MTKSLLVRWMLVLLVCLATLALFTVLLHFAVGGTPFGADFYTFWLGAKAVFAERINPYSAEVTLASQMGIYGRAAYPTEDQVAFAYPPFSLLAILPAAWMEFGWARAFWMALNILTILGVLLFGLSAFQRKVTLGYLIFYPVAFGLILGNFAVLMGSLMTLVLYRLVLANDTAKGWQIAGGLLLAWCTAKPQFVYLFALFLVLWALRKRRWLFLGSLAASVVGLWGLAFLLVPGWLGTWLGRIVEYAGYVQSQLTLETLLSLVFPPMLAHTLTLILAAGLVCGTLVLLWTWWKGKLTSLPMIAWLGWLTYLLHPRGIAYEQITFLVPLLLWVATADKIKKWQMGLFWVGSIFISWLCFALGKWVLHPLDAMPVVWNGVWVVWLLIQSFKEQEGEVA